MRRWKDTPEGERDMAERLDGARVRFSELRAGDVFRIVGACGSYANIHGEIDESRPVYRACEDARKADGTECAQDYGWCVPAVQIDLAEALS